MFKGKKVHLRIVKMMVEAHMVTSWCLHPFFKYQGDMVSGTIKKGCLVFTLYVLHLHVIRYTTPMDWHVAKILGVYLHPFGRAALCDS